MVYCGTSPHSVSTGSSRGNLGLVSAQVVSGACHASREPTRLNETSPVLSAVVVPHAEVGADEAGGRPLGFVDAIAFDPFAGIFLEPIVCGRFQ
jgi:hypothetical protein